MSEHFDPDEMVPVLTCDGCARESGGYDDERKGWVEVEPWVDNEGKQNLDRSGSSSAPSALRRGGTSKASRGFGSKDDGRCANSRSLGRFALRPAR